MLNDLDKSIFPGIDIPRTMPTYGPCGCMTCVSKHLEEVKGGWLSMPFIVCPTCGNKRCPKANFHENACTGSNAPSQPGSAYEDIGWCKHCHGPIVKATFGELVRMAEEFGLERNSPVERGEGPKIWRHRDTANAACDEPGGTVAEPDMEH